MAHSALPEGLGDRFRVVDALSAGVRPGRLRSADLEAPFHGVRARLAAESSGLISRDRRGSPLGPLERDHLHRARAYAAKMPEHQFFTHITAAVIWGLPLAAWFLQGAPIHVGVVPPHRLPRGAGVRGHEVVAASTQTLLDSFTGLRVASPAATWATLGSAISDDHDLVAAADAVVRDWRVAPLATIGELDATVRAGRRVGVQALRDALPLVRTRAASRPETRVRLALLEAALAEPELNFDVWEAEMWLACVDLAYPHLKIAIEYEGEHHLLSAEQWARDIERYDTLAAAGWKVIRVTKGELFNTPRLMVARVVAAIAERS